MFAAQPSTIHSLRLMPCEVAVFVMSFLNSCASFFPAIVKVTLADIFIYFLVTEARFLLAFFTELEKGAPFTVLLEPGRHLRPRLELAAQLKGYSLGCQRLLRQRCHRSPKFRAPAVSRT